QPRGLNGPPSRPSGATAAPGQNAPGTGAVGSRPESAPGFAVCAQQRKPTKSALRSRRVTPDGEKISLHRAAAGSCAKDPPRTSHVFAAPLSPSQAFSHSATLPPMSKRPVKPPSHVGVLATSLTSAGGASGPTTHAAASSVLPYG